MPYTISINKNKTIIFSFKGHNVSITVSWERNRDISFPYESINDAYLYIPYDKFGITGKTRCKIQVNSFFDITNDIDGFLDFCTEAFNYFLQNYKYVSDNFWLDNLCLHHIFVTSALVQSENFEIINVPFYSPKELSVSDKLYCIETEKVEALEDNLRSGFFPPLWHSLQQDAKGYLVVEKYREAVLSINSAFENYLSLFARRILSRAMTKEQIDDYLNGITTYEDFELKNYLSEKQFEEAISSGVIKPSPPSTFSIVKKCIKLGQMNISFSQAKKLVNTIRKNRNDLIHGNNTTNNIAIDAKNSVNAFDNFIGEFR